MSLWGKLDAEASRPKWINLATYPAGTAMVFVDTEESQIASNKSKGITGPGWWLYREWTDSDGASRYWSECVVAMSVGVATSGDDADDAIVPDVLTTIAISVQPADQTTVSGAATFAVTAAFSAGTGTLEYQWQRKVGTGRWTAINGATSASLVLAGQIVDNDGEQFRVVVSGGGAKAVTSDAATLTFGD